MKKTEKENVHSGHRSRMRKRVLLHGAETLETHELLEMLLYYCNARKNTNIDAHAVLDKMGSLSALFQADTKDLMRRCNFSEHTAVFFVIALEMMKRCSMEKWKQKLVLNSDSEAGQFAISLLSYEVLECFYVFHLDNQNRLLKASLINRGMPNESRVEIRDVVESVIRNQATRVILAHNHPGGTLESSKEDKKITYNLIHTLGMMGVEILDHIIVADEQYFSMQEHKQLLPL